MIGAGSSGASGGSVLVRAVHGVSLAAGFICLAVWCVRFARAKRGVAVARRYWARPRESEVACMQPSG